MLFAVAWLIAAGITATSVTLAWMLLADEYHRAEPHSHGNLYG